VTLFGVMLGAGTCPSAGDGASRTGEVEFTDTHTADRSLRATESAILRSGPQAAAEVLSLTGLHLFVAESEREWNSQIAVGLDKALEDGPLALAAFVDGLGPSIVRAGPDLQGAVMQFELPGERGEGTLAIYFPELLERTGKDTGRLNAVAPNKGLYVSGVSVKRSRRDVPAFSGMYLPSRPKGLTRGKIPSVRLRGLPRDGRGDLAILKGKGASGDNADRYREELERLSGTNTFSARSLREFPKGGEGLVRSLRTSRSEQTVIQVTENWPRTLAAGPQNWVTESVESSHPTRYLSFSAPVAVSDETGARTGTVILGGVALYTPLMLQPEEARRYVNKSPSAFFGSVHRGELSFFQEGEDVFFFRGHLDEWREGRGRQRRGRSWRRKALPDRIKELAVESRAKRLTRASSSAMPTRFQKIPSEELSDRLSDPPQVRRRVFDGDLLGWLKHWDRKAQIGGPDPVFSMRATQRGARFEAAFDLTSDAELTERLGEGEPILEVVDVYPVYPSCTPGEPLLGVVEFVLDRIPDGEEAELVLEWSSSSGGPALARLSAGLLRVAGEHEVLFEAGCPSSGTTAELGVSLTWPATGLEVSGRATVQIGR